MVHTCDRCNKPFKKLWMLNRHLQNRKFPCRPRPIPTPDIITTHAPKVVHPLKYLNQFHKSIQKQDQVHQLKII